MIDVKDWSFENARLDFETSLDQRDNLYPQLLAANPDYVCKYFARGQCVKGGDCSYKHLKGEKSVVCKHWLQSLCKKGRECGFLHQYDLARMPVCQFYAQFGECNNGEECLFLHPEPKKEECPFYLQGYCPEGPQCKRNHTQKVVCERFLAGFCPDGPNCRFGHPNFDLKITEMMSLSEEQANSSNVKPSPSLGNPANAYALNLVST